MRYALIAALLIVLSPAVAQAGGSKFGFSYYDRYGLGHGHYYPPVYYSYPYYPYRPYYGYHGGFHKRYVVPRVYSPYRYGDYRSDYWRDYAYRRDYQYRRDLYRDPQRYYGPAVERYHRDRRDYPSYHYERREAYNRGPSDGGTWYRR